MMRIRKRYLWSGGISIAIVILGQTARDVHQHWPNEAGVYDGWLILLVDLLRNSPWLSGLAIVISLLAAYGFVDWLSACLRERPTRPHSSK